MLISLVSTLFLAFLLPTQAAEHHRVVRSRHNGRAVANRSHPFTVHRPKLGARSSFTYYEAGLGACGGTNSGSDFIVAMSAQDWDNGAHCNAQITITINGKSTQATIVDECMGCPSNDLDFSEGLFKFFGDTSQGVLSGSWSYGSGQAPSPTSTWQAPTSTSQWTPPSSSSSAWTPSSSSPPSSSARPTSSSVFSSIIASSSAVSSAVSSAAPSASSLPEDAGFVGVLNTLMVQMANVALSGQIASNN
ncbi:RlpA-like double-psi beta-barrel-protein domain-containing protein-containing protein [Mucidula mucida]|nr:RlpA-like double-psi beta-barrel-protein domain-containing protein-containing protein [Mucidula mucida]